MSTCTAALPSSSNGMKTRLTRNALVRTAARYSRTAMTQVLRIGTLSLLGPGDADEDLLECGPGHLEVAHPAALQQQGQQTLRVGVAFQAQLLPAAEVRHPAH